MFSECCKGDQNERINESPRTKNDDTISGVIETSAYPDIESLSLISLNINRQTKTCWKFNGKTFDI